MDNNTIRYLKMHWDATDDFLEGNVSGIPKPNKK